MKRHTAAQMAAFGRIYPKWLEGGSENIGIAEHKYNGDKEAVS